LARRRADINGIDLATRKRNLSSVVRKMRGALCEQHCRLCPRKDRDEDSGRPDWPHRGDCRDQFRIGVVIIEARDEVRIGKRFRRVE